MAKKEIDNKKENKENKVKKHFFKDMKAELKRVIWPTKKQLVNNTVAVVTIVFIVVAIVFVLDSVFDIMNQYGITKLQSYVVESFKKEDKVEDNNNNADTTQDDGTSTNEDQNTDDNQNTDAGESQGTESNPETVSNE